MEKYTSVVCRAHVQAVTERELAAELDQQLNFSEAALTVLFCDSGRDLATLEAEIAEKAPTGLVIGCTTAGEIGDRGYCQGGVSGLSLLKSDFKACAVRFTSLRDVTTDDAVQQVASLVHQLAAQVPGSLEGKCFAILLVDGMAFAEEPLTYKIQHALGRIPLVGGSAGDNYDFQSTHILIDGHFCTDSAVIALVYTERPWEVFKEQHFVPSSTKAVVTEADPDTRRIVELNAEPAAEEFARLLGLDGPEALTPSVFASNPLMVQLQGSWYIRSGQKANDDGSLTLFCAIDEGMVLSLGQNEDMVEHLTSTLSGIEQRLGSVQATLAFDCIQRKQELENLAKLGEASAVLQRHHAVGFSTYGEQFGALHINQTLTGIAIG